MSIGRRYVERAPGRRGGLSLAALTAGALLVACSPDAGRAPDGSPKASAGAPGAGTPLFREVAAQSGIAFTHANGMNGNFYYAEIIGSGVAVFDYDNDGKL